MRLKQYIILRSDLGMSRGKMVAQGCHASLGAYKTMFLNKDFKNLLDNWEQSGGAKICLDCDNEEELMDICLSVDSRGIPFYLVQDNGLTEIPKDSVTALAIGPWDEKEIKEIKSMKLLK